MTSYLNEQICHVKMYKRQDFVDFNWVLFFQKLTKSYASFLINQHSQNLNNYSALSIFLQLQRQYPFSSFFFMFFSFTKVSTEVGSYWMSFDWGCCVVLCAVWYYIFIRDWQYSARKLLRWCCAWEESVRDWRQRGNNYKCTCRYDRCHITTTT